MAKLKDRNCVPCEGGAAPLSAGDALRLSAELSGWELSRNSKSLSKDMVFRNFDKAMDFVNTVADFAEQEGHHPDISISYNKVRLVLTTHAIKGLSENDFILAAKIDGIDL